MADSASAAVVVDGDRTVAWFWLGTRGSLVLVLGAAFALSSETALPAVVAGVAMSAYVLGWFVYLLLLPSRVRYEFATDVIRLSRAGRLIKEIRTSDVERFSPSWWETSDSGMFPGVWLWLPRLTGTLRSGVEFSFPSVTFVETSGVDIAQEIADITALPLESSLDKKVFIPRHG